MHHVIVAAECLVAVIVVFRLSALLQAYEDRLMRRWRARNTPRVYDQERDAA